MTDPSAAIRTPSTMRALLERQLERFETLNTLSASQQSIIEAGDSRRLLEILRDRERLLDEIRGANAEIEPLLRASEQPRAPVASRDEARALMSRMDELVEEIAGRDEQCRRDLEVRRDRVAGELEALSRRRSALSAYAGAPSEHPRYQDREG